jgi:hypothetical protein
MSGRVSAVRFAGDPAGAWTLGVVAKRTYLVERGALVEAQAQIPLVEEPVFGPEETVLLHDTDLLLNRTATDVIVQGHAYSYGPRAVFDAGVGIGAFARVMRVAGDRRVEWRPDRVRFTAPKPIEEKLPLGWERAYGGIDQAARLAIGDPIEAAQVDAGLLVDPCFGLFAYPRNPVGRGYLLQPTREACDACELPNFEDPSALLTPETVVRNDFVRWPDGPPVASLGWLSYAYFPRSAQIGIPPKPYELDRIKPQHFAEVRAGILRAPSVRPEAPVEQRLDIGVGQCSAVGMRVPNIAWRSSVELLNLHPTTPNWRFTLPTRPPTMALKLEGRQPEQLQPAIRTILIEPDENRVCLVFVGQMGIPAPLEPERAAAIQHAVIWN